MRHRHDFRLDKGSDVADRQLAVPQGLDDSQSMRVTQRFQSLSAKIRLKNILCHGPAVHRWNVHSFLQQSECYSSRARSTSIANDVLSAPVLRARLLPAVMPHRTCSRLCNSVTPFLLLGGLARCEAGHPSTQWPTKELAMRPQFLTLRVCFAAQSAESCHGRPRDPCRYRSSA